MSTDVDMFDKEKSRDEVRAELSKMSFTDLQKLKERLGTKVYNAAMFGKEESEKKAFKRENKNRPREISAKRPVSRFKEVVQVKKIVPRDPRFDSLCGEFNEKVFKKSYSFLYDLKKNDLEVLKKELRITKEPKRMKKIKFLIQRLENQIKAEEKKRQQEFEKQQEKQEVIRSIESGEKPKFIKKSDKKILNLVNQYKELKDTGKLQKHIKRIRKKKFSKERQKLEEFPPH